MMKKFAIGAAAALMLSGSAYAQSTVTAATDLNIRSGPGSHYPVVGMIDVNGRADLRGCNGNWCQVSYRGAEGWAYGRYLSDGSQVIIAERAVGAPQITHQSSGATLNVAAGVVGGGISGLIIGGPIGAAVGVIAGAGLGAATAK